MSKKKVIMSSVKAKHSLDVNNRDNSKKIKKGDSDGDGSRSAATIRRLKMYNTRPKRDSKGHILKHDLQSSKLPSTRIQPSPSWFSTFHD
ncbi:hypothetical protein Leryth_025562 [Lithospermum erythrorhizon]|nr:hypothetical protein Leryth_025562 [Lithospermum erythrorhizon]